MSAPLPETERAAGTIRVRVNDQDRMVPMATSLAELLATIGGAERKGTAAAVNGAVVPRKAWSDHRLAADDQVLVIRATQGG